MQVSHGSVSSTAPADAPYPRSASSSRRRRAATTVSSSPASNSPSLGANSSNNINCINVSSDVEFAHPPSFPQIEHRLQSWVVFSDLHVSSRTLDTAVRVLQRVHEEAQRRNAGVVFLGKPAVTLLCMALAGSMSSACLHALLGIQVMYLIMTDSDCCGPHVTEVLLLHWSQGTFGIVEEICRLCP